jgi:hypothetical protein
LKSEPPAERVVELTSSDLSKSRSTARYRRRFWTKTDPRNFFNEEDPAVLRMARSFAESIVSTLVNGFGVKD